MKIKTMIKHLQKIGIEVTDWSLPYTYNSFYLVCENAVEDRLDDPFTIRLSDHDSEKEDHVHSYVAHESYFSGRYENTNLLNEKFFEFLPEIKKDFENWKNGRKERIGEYNDI